MHVEIRVEARNDLVEASAFTVPNVRALVTIMSTAFSPTYIRFNRRPAFTKSRMDCTANSRSDFRLQSIIVSQIL